jgi:malonate transporter and related proteins
MLHVLVSIIPIFLLIATGYAIKNYFYKSEDFWRTAEGLTYYLFFPSLLILKVSEADFNSSQVFWPLVAVIVATALVAALTFLVKAMMSPENSIFTSIFQGSTRYNSYVFIGLSSALFGASAIAITGIFIAYMIVITNVMSVIVMNQYGQRTENSVVGANVGSKGFRTVLLSLAKNPLIVSAIAGLTLNYFKIGIAGVTYEFMHSLGAIASPLSLLSVGAGLMLQIGRERVFATAYSSLLKLIAMPLITILLLRYFNATGVSANIAVLYASVPTAGNAYILARQMGGDATSIASIITATTLGAVVSVTLILGSFL